MLPSAFRFFEALARFPGHTVYRRNDLEPADCIRVSSPFHSQDVVKSFLCAIRELVTGLLVAFVYSLLLEDCSSVVFDNTQFTRKFRGRSWIL